MHANTALELRMPSLSENRIEFLIQQVHVLKSLLGRPQSAIRDNQLADKFEDLRDLLDILEDNALGNQ